MEADQPTGLLHSLRHEIFFAYKIIYRFYMQKSTEILHVLAPIFRGATPKFLEFSASFEPVSDHVAKFRGDRPRDLGDVAA